MKVKEITNLAKELHSMIGNALTLQECYDFIKKIQATSQTLPSEEEIEKLAKQAANRSQFLSDYPYDHKSYETGYIEGATTIRNKSLQQENQTEGDMFSDTKAEDLVKSWKENQTED